MIGKIRCYLGEVSYWFSRSFVKFQGHAAKRMVDIDPNWDFPDCKSSLNDWWPWNDTQSLKQHRRDALFFSMSSVKFQGHTGHKIADFDSNLAFPNCSPSFNSLMGLKLCTKLGVVYRMCRIVFQCYPSNFKVTRDNKSPILTRIERFRTLTPVWIHQWIWNDEQSLT